MLLAPRRLGIFVTSLLAFALVQASPAFSQSGTSSASADSSADKRSAGASASKACSAAQAAKLNVVSGVSVSDVCNTVISAWTNRQIVPNPPRLYFLTDANQAFGDKLSSSMKVIRRTTNVVVVVNLPKPVTIDDLKAAKAPDYKESELGIWLDRIDNHNGVVQQKDTEAIPAALAFEWIGKPVIQFLINRFFKRDP